MQRKPTPKPFRQPTDESAVLPKPRPVEEKPSLVRCRRRVKSTKEQQENQILVLRNRAFRYTLISSAATLFLVFVIMLLQGFQLWGFNLPGQLLYTLLAATVGKVAESLFIVMRFVFKV